MGNGKEYTLLEQIARVTWWLMHGEAVPSRYAAPVRGVLPLCEQDGLVYLRDTNHFELPDGLSKRQQIAILAIQHLMREDLRAEDLARRVGVNKRVVYSVLCEISRVVPIYCAGRRWRVAVCDN